MTQTSPITESRLQSDCFTYHWNNYPDQRKRLFMVYNNPKNAAHGSIMKAMGMIAGCSDLIFLAPQRRIFFLECKLPNGIQSPEQKSFQKMCEDMGHEYRIFRSIEEFKAIMGEAAAPF